MLTPRLHPECDGGHALEVDFEIWVHVDLIRWRVRGGTHLAFELRVDGHPIVLENIYPSADSSRPDRTVFRVAR